VPGDGRLILFNKPYGVLCQFSGARACLRHFVPVVGVYPAGRLDADSEGLVLLTDDGRLQHLITDPRRKWAKTYWVQVEGRVTEAALSQMRRGVALADGRTRRCEARRLDPAPSLWPREPPVRHRLTVPTDWIETVLTEGRNRQVRRMTAAVGFPTLRLVRVRVGPYGIEGLAPGEWREAAARSSA
jgi:23S rRNA pseudouridine2457 synthase